MQPNYKILGKVCLTANGKWDKTKKYDKISIVFNDTDNTSYIYRQDVVKSSSCNFLCMNISFFFLKHPWFYRTKRFI